MKKVQYAFLLGLILLYLSSCSMLNRDSTESVYSMDPSFNRVQSTVSKTIMAETYYDKTRGALIGELVGNFTGLPNEFSYITEPKPADFEPWLYLDPWTTDDDTSMEWVFLHMMEDNGLDSITYAQMVPEWQEHFYQGSNQSLWAANLNALQLMNQGLLPPATGKRGNNNYWDSLDAQIEIEIFGQIAPGMVVNALGRADYWARVTNDEHAVDTASFYAAVMADAYFTSDPIALVNNARSLYPSNSYIYQIATDLLNWHNQYPNWRDTRQKVYEKYWGDPPYTGGWSDNVFGAEVNFASTIMALLYGNGDFENTIQIALLSGFDRDCNAATVGKIIGTVVGYSGIPSHIKDQCSNRYVNTNRSGLPSEDSITNIVSRTQALAEENILLRNGTITGTGSGKTYTILDGAFIPPSENDSIIISSNGTTRVQAEDFSYMEGMEVETDKVNADGKNLGYISVGDWAAYKLNFEEAKDYDVTFRVSGEGAAGEILFEYQDGAPLGRVSAGNTGDWDNWVVTETIKNVSFAQGIVNVAIAVPASGYNVDWIEFTPSNIVVEQAPYHGTPIAIPGILEVEDYDLGGPGVAFYDSDSVNEGGDYRNDGVDIQALSHGGYGIGWTLNGEWLEYTVNVNKTASYNIETEIAALDNGGEFSLAIDNQEVANFQFSESGGWDIWKKETLTNIPLTAGTHILRINIKQSHFNINYLKFTESYVSDQQPYHGLPVVLPGTIQAEDYDIGGEGISYSDSDTVNEGGDYRNDGVDIQASDQVVNVGWVTDGEWLEYTVDVQEAGEYFLEAQVASLISGGHFTVDINNRQIADIQFGMTGGWQKWRTETSQRVFLSSGKQIIRVNIKQAGFNLDSISIVKKTVGDDFTFVVIPDTQHITSSDTGGLQFINATQWIVDQRTNLSVEFVSHLGDMTNDWARDSQWDRAERAMDVLRDNGMRYSPAQGNHDYIGSLRERFPVSDFQGKPWFDSYHGGMENACYTFSAAGMDFVVVVIQSHSQYEANDLYDLPSIEWANQKFREHSDKKGIFVTHDMYERNWIQNDVIKKNDNIVLAVSGHSSWNGGEDNWTVTTEGGNTVHCVMSDYQHNTEGGQATLRYYTFKPQQDKIFAYTYNPTTNTYGTEFSLYLDM